MGEDSVTPFLTYEGKWVILLALTSNKGSHDFQLTEDVNGERLFEKVLRKSQEWAGDDRMMYVVGATKDVLFEDIRKIVPEPFPSRTRRGSTRRFTRRSLQIWYEQYMRIDC